MFLVTGDLNLVGGSQQLRTLLTGDIVDEATFGPDVAPDWDGSALADLVSSQTEKRFAYTWRNDFGSYAPGRLDFFIYSDSVVTAGNHFLLYTPEMSPGELATDGLQSGDVTTVSDHLPHTADFRARVATDAGLDVAARGPVRAWATLRDALPLRERVSVHLALVRPAHAQVEIYGRPGCPRGHVARRGGRAAAGVY